MSPTRAMVRSAAGGGLAALARRCGVQRRYVDGAKQRRTASDEAVLAVLRAMKLAVDRPEDAGSELRRLEAEDAARLVEPVVVRWIGSAAGLRLGRGATSPVEARIETASGRAHAWRGTPSRPAGRGEGPVLPVPPGFDLDTEPGVHRLEISGKGRTDAATLLVAPPVCFSPASERRPDVGVFLPLYAVRDEGTPGVGTVRELDRLAAWAGSCGAGLVGTLPLLATFLDEPFEPSPYAPVSRSVFGELFVDLAGAAARHELEGLRSLLKSTAYERAAAAARAGDLVDYRAAWSLVRWGLEAAAADVFATPRLRAEVEAFERGDALIGAYAAFRASRAADADQEATRRLYLTGQWLLAEQLGDLAARARGGEAAGLYLDLPIGSHRHGFDTHRYPGLHAEGVSLGAPPDGLFMKGQDWGFPPVVPSASRALGHASLVSAIERHLSVSRALRIDHAAGLHRGFWVPEGFGATEGVYVHTRADEHYAVLSVLSHRYGASIIGENLGTVPREVNRALRRRGVLRMSIGQFELGGEASPLPRPERSALAALNTHDMPTFAAHWEGLDIPLHARLGVVDPADAEALAAGREAMRRRTLAALRKRGRIASDEAEAGEVLRALLAAMADAGPELLLINLEDLWLETRPQNVPGVVEGFESWRRRAAWTLDRITSDEGVGALVGSLAGAASRPGSRAGRRKGA